MFVNDVNSIFLNILNLQRYRAAISKIFQKIGIYVKVQRFIFQTL